MTEPRLTLACWDYDRTRALLDGRVAVEGWGIDATPIASEDLFAPESLELPGT